MNKPVDRFGAAIGKIDRERARVRAVSRGLSRGRLSPSAYGRLPPISTANSGWLVGAGRFALRRILGAAGAVFIPSELADGTLDLTNPVYTAIYSPPTLAASPDWQQVQGPGGKVYVPADTPPGVVRSINRGLVTPDPDLAPVALVNNETVKRLSVSPEGWAAISGIWRRSAQRAQAVFDRQQATLHAVADALTLDRDAFLQNILAGDTLTVPNSVGLIGSSNSGWLQSQFASEWDAMRANFKKLADTTKAAAVEYAEWKVAEDRRNALERKLRQALERRKTELRKRQVLLRREQEALRRAIARQAEIAEKRLAQSRKRLVARQQYRLRLARSNLATTRYEIRKAESDLRRLLGQKRSAANLRAIAEARARLRIANIRANQLVKVPGKPVVITPDPDPGTEPKPVPEPPVIPVPIPPPGRVDVGVDLITNRIWANHRPYAASSTRRYQRRKDDKKEGGEYRAFLRLINKTYGRFDEVVDLTQAFSDAIRPGDGQSIDKSLWRATKGPDGEIVWKPKDLRSAMILFADPQSEFDWASFAKDVVANQVEDWLFSLQPDKSVYDFHRPKVGLGAGPAL